MSSGSVSFKVVPHGSEQYWEAVELRRKILRRPLGLDFEPEALAQECGEMHVIALRENKVIACLVLRVLEPREYQMRQVAVDTSFQGTGIGSALVKYSEGLCREQGAKAIILHAREPVVRFYERLDYSVEGESFVEVGLPHRQMRKSL